MGCFKVGLTSIVCGLLLISTVSAQKPESVDPAKSEPGKEDASAIDFSTLDPEAMEKMAKEFAELAPEHELFKKMEGSWTTEVKTFYPDPSQPSVNTGTSEYKLMMGGRYLVEHFKSEFEGEPFEGAGATAFDKTKQKYVGFWFDNMGTGFMQTEGTYDDKTRTLTQTGSADTPLGRMNMKMVSKHVDEDTTIFTIYMITPEGEMKNMEITYKRK